MIRLLPLVLSSIIVLPWFSISPAFASTKPWSISCNSGRRECIASGFSSDMQNMRISWWQTIPGKGGSSWGSTVESDLTARMSGTSANDGECSIWYVSYSGDRSPNFAIIDWVVIGSTCPVIPSPTPTRTPAPTPTPTPSPSPPPDNTATPAPPTQTPNPTASVTSTPTGGSDEGGVVGPTPNTSGVVSASPGESPLTDTSPNPSPSLSHSASGERDASPQAGVAAVIERGLATLGLLLLGVAIIESVGILLRVNRKR
jgi:hypothetical protein